jgi:hypothetical protein
MNRPFFSTRPGRCAPGSVFADPLKYLLPQDREETGLIKRDQSGVKHSMSWNGSEEVTLNPHSEIRNFKS